MRLLKCNENDELSLTEHFGTNIPPYAILSHTWGADGEEVTFEDMKNGTGKDKAGHEKIRLCKKEAIRDGLRYFWVDTCCIDKSSSAELSEAINSMYAWYKKAEICYAYLGDISGSALLHQARWFTRGWTLQELIAPSRIKFFSRDWNLIGTKDTLQGELSAITGIDGSTLAGGPLSEAPVAQRMSWASERSTTRVEDIAYCLLGLFDVHMPLLYGEGMKAFRRLQEEIIKQSDDHSLFAWVPSPADVGAESITGCLAASPAQFAGARDVFPYPAEIQEPYSMTNKGLRILLPVTKIADDSSLYLAALSCCRQGADAGLVILNLTQLRGDQFARWNFAMPRKRYDLQAAVTWEKRLIYIKNGNDLGNPSHYWKHAIEIQLSVRRSLVSHNDLFGLGHGFRLASVTPLRNWNGRKLMMYPDHMSWNIAEFVFERGEERFSARLILVKRLHFVISSLSVYVLPEVEESSDSGHSVRGLIRRKPTPDSNDENFVFSTTSRSVVKAKLRCDIRRLPQVEVRVSIDAVVGSNIISLEVDIVEVDLVEVYTVEVDTVEVDTVKDIKEISHTMSTD